jgi:hypothetical protein
MGLLPGTAEIRALGRGVPLCHRQFCDSGDACAYQRCHLAYERNYQRRRNTTVYLPGKDQFGQNIGGVTVNSPPAIRR